MNTLITESLQRGDVHLLFNLPKPLLTSLEKHWIEWIQEYTSRYGKPPSVARLGKQFDGFIPVHSADPLGDIYDLALTKARNHYTRNYLTSIQEELKDGVDPLPFINELQATIRTGQGDITRYSSFDRTSYYRRPTAYPYEINQIDKQTGGISAGDLIYLIGRLGTGKTTFALWILSKWLQRGRKILMVSNENRAEDVVAKIDSYLGGFNPLRKRTSDWTSSELNRLRTVSYIASAMPGEVYIPNRPVQDVKEIRSLIYTFQPDIVMVDGIYLMAGSTGDSHWEKITNISRSLKQVADGEGVPILGIHQANRQAIGRRIEVEHVAYADALAQDADLMLAINPEEDGSLFVEAIKNRWGGDHWGFFVRFYFETMSVRVMDGKLVETGDEEE